MASIDTTKSEQQNAELMLEAVEVMMPGIREAHTELSNNMFMQAVNKAIDYLTEKYLKDKTSCSKGCSFCCHDEIRMSSFEADYIKGYVFSNKIIPNRRLLKKQSRKPYSELSFADKQCSLLKNGECSIYEARPLICRTYNSTVEPERCKDPIDVPCVRSGEILGILGSVIQLHHEKNGLLEFKLNQILK